MANMKGHTIMSILKHSYKMYVVWDNVGGFAHFVGSYEQCRQYVKENS